MKFKVNLRALAPASFIGGIISALVYLMLEGYAQAAESQANAPSALLFLVISALAFIFGGFLAGYLVAKDDKACKDRLVAGALAGFFSGILSAIIIAGITMGLNPQLLATETSAEAFTLAGDLGNALIFATGIIAFVQAFGGIVAALLLGIKGSELAAVFWKTKDFLTKDWRAVLPVLFFSLVSLGIGLLLGSVANTPDIWLTMLLFALALVIMLLLIAFSYAAVMIGVGKFWDKKKMGTGRIITEAVFGSKNVFLSMLVALLPPIVLLGIIISASAAAGETTMSAFMNPLTAVLLLLIQLCVIVYLVILSFVPQIAFIENAEKRRGILRIVRDGFDFGMKNFFGIVAFMIVAGMIALTMEFVFGLIIVGAESLGNIGPYLATGLDLVFGAIIITFVISAQTYFYHSAR